MATKGSGKPGRIFHVLSSAPRRLTATAHHIGEIRRFLADPSMTQTCYPEVERKSRSRIFRDLVLWAFRHDELNRYYFSYGLDRKCGIRYDQYVASRESISYVVRSNTNVRIGTRNVDYRCLCMDKLLFGTYVAALGFPTPGIAAVYDGKRILWPGRAAEGVAALLGVDGLDVFCKDLVGGKGARIFPMTVRGGRLTIRGREATLEELEKELTGPAIFERRLEQHPRMSELNPSSVNTIRLVTVMREGDVQPFGALVRCGAKGRYVDNWAVGGIAVGVNLDTGRLMPRGIFGPGKGGAAFSHPDTGAVFDGFEIPCFKEAVALARRLHPFFYGLPSIGWDIAVTPEGPSFIEGNERWDTRLMQAVLGGIKDRLLREVPPPGEDSRS